MSALQDSATLASALHDAGCYPHAVDRVDEIETHISRVLLAGEYAYKLKKPVRLPFLDFTSLEARRRYCEEELRLNRRLAPDLYLDVVPITGTLKAPHIGGSGTALEYAVRLRRFAQSALLDCALHAGTVDAAVVASLAQLLARFHAQAPAGEPQFQTGTRVLAAALENFDELTSLLTAPAERAQLDDLRQWTRDTYDAHAAGFDARAAGGFIRECHGDLHLGNIVLWDGSALPFDCIEFNAGLRWIDVIDEVAFLAMDFESHGRRDLAYILMNAYLESSGDYAGADLLPFYFVYRAMVRAKVNAIRASQPDATGAERDRDAAACRRYLDVGRMHACTQRGAVIITHGYAGSGKSTLAGELVARLGAIRIRSDVERKRLHGLPTLARTNAAVGTGIYSADNNQRTYASMLAHARCIAGAGFIAIVDATFLETVQRAAFHTLAAALDVPFAIVALEAPVDCLRRRIAQRAVGLSDASEASPAVLDAQLKRAEPLTKQELAVTVRTNAEDFDITHVAKQLKAMLTAAR